MGTSLLCKKFIIGLRGLNFNVLICPLCKGAIMISHQNFTTSTSCNVEIVSKVWFWENDGMGWGMVLEMCKVIFHCWTKPQSLFRLKCFNLHKLCGLVQQ